MNGSKNMNDTAKISDRKWASPVNLLMLLAAIFVIGIVALGGYLFMGRSIVQTVQEQDQQLFPPLSDARAAINGITIERGGDRLGLARREDGRWGLANWDGYPVEEDRVNGLIDSLASLRGVQASTDRVSTATIPDLRNLDTVTRVTVRDDRGSVLAGLLIGDTVATPGGAEINRTFVQPVETERAWLSAREITVPIDRAAWINAIILDIAAERIASARLRDASGMTLSIVRQENMEQPFRPTGLPEGARVSEAWQLTRMAGALEKLQIVEARRANDALLPPDADGVEAEFETRNGLRVKLAMVRKDDMNWAEIHAEADAANEARQEAEAIRSRTEGWHFRLPDFAADGFITDTGAVIDAAAPRSASGTAAPQR